MPKTPKNIDEMPDGACKESMLGLYGYCIDHEKRLDAGLKHFSKMDDLFKDPRSNNGKRIALWELREQIEHTNNKFKFQDYKVNAICAIVVIILALLGVMLALGEIS